MLVTKTKVKVDWNRNKPKKVLFTDLETRQKTVHPSIYKPSRARGCPTTQIFLKNGCQLLRVRYKIDIIGGEPVGDDGVSVIKSE